jgi:tetratricopeptide (TPR) repeat protein
MPDKARNQLYSNLGQAYVANHEYQKAVSAFEQALADKTYFLNDAASVDYQQAIAQVSSGASQKEEAKKADTSGLDVPAADAPEYNAAAGATDDHAAGDGAVDMAQQPTQAIPPVTETEATDEERFFTQTDEELEQWSKGKAKEERKQRHTGRKVLIALLLLILIAAGVAAFGYTQGYGWPTQEQMTKELFANPDHSESLFAPSVDKEKIDQTVKFIVQSDDVKIDGVDRAMDHSEVYATSGTTDGSKVKYKVSFKRDLAGWKITDVELNFSSMG